MIIGIDPDTDKSGVAVLNAPYVIRTIELYCLELYPIFELCKKTEAVFLEAGWLNARGGSFSKSKKMAVEWGRNFEIGKQIERFCKKQKIPVFLYRPDSEKWSHQDFSYITDSPLKRSNQEQRDATRAMLQNKMFSAFRQELLKK